MSYVDDLDDLIGTAKPLPKRDEKVSLRTIDLHQVTRGVSIPWLVRVFRMGRAKVEMALRDCEPASTTPNGAPLYDLKEAAAYLVEPKKDFKDRLKSITAKDLPDELKETFWNAKLKEAKYRALAGELWTTPSVMEVLGETFKTIKSTAQLWTDTIEDTVSLTDKQRALQVKLVDRLLDNLHKALVKQAQSKATKSLLEELEGANEG
jgi:hypothetical protein